MKIHTVEFHARPASKISRHWTSTIPTAGHMIATVGSIYPTPETAAREVYSVLTALCIGANPTTPTRLEFPTNCPQITIERILQLCHEARQQTPPATSAGQKGPTMTDQRVSPSDARPLSAMIAWHLAETFLSDLVTPDIFKQDRDAFEPAVNIIAARIVQYAPRDLEQLEINITDADNPPAHAIAAHLSQSLKQLAAVKPADVRSAAVEGTDAWRETLE